MAVDSVGYSVVIHRRALDELQAFDSDVGHDLRERVLDAATERQPKSHPCVEQIESYEPLLRVKGDGVRAIVALDPPTLLVLLVDTRRVVYDRLDVALARLADASAGGDA